MPQPAIHADNAAKQRAYRKRQAEARAAEREQKGLPAAPAIPTMPSAARWGAMEFQAYELLRKVQTEMEDYHADRSETWQESDKGEEFQRRLDSISEAVDALEQLR